MLQSILHQRRAGAFMLALPSRPATDKRTCGRLPALLAVGAGISAAAFQSVLLEFTAVFFIVGIASYLRYRHAVHENWTRVLFLGCVEVSAVGSAILTSDMMGGN